MSKKRCPHCKKYNQTKDTLKVNISFFCNIDCATSYAFKNKEKGRKIKHAKQKKEFQANDTKLRKKAAVMACHAYIRARDVNNGCITCGAPLTDVKFDAGHFFKSTNSYTKFMEKNIHGQCVSCNQYNGGREREYEHALIEKYGEITVKALKKLRTKKITRTASDYLEIEKYFKSKLNDINKNTN